MPIKEIRGYLFKSNEPLAHCVSLDFKMGAGIARHFSAKFGKISELVTQTKNIGDVAYLIDLDRHIFYLVTKKLYYQKPTYKSLKLALYNLYYLCKKFEIKSISMPKIGCGLDKLDWSKVKNIIADIFTDIDVTIYYIS